MACLDEVLREQPGSTTELQDEPGPLQDGLKDRQNPGCHRIRVEPEPFVMDARQIRSVVRRGRHTTQSCHSAPS